MNKKILVVGCGSIGERHIRCLLTTRRADITACDNRPALLEKISHQYGVPAYPAMEEALNSGSFDGVLIATPANTHVALALNAVRAGAGVMIEKPLSTSLDQIDELISEAKRLNAWTGVAYIHHFIPMIQQAREFLLAGSFGVPLHAWVVCGQHFPTFRPAYRETYYTRHETGGGSIQDGLTHMVNSMEWMLGPTLRVFCDAANQALDGIQVEDTVNAIATNGKAMVSYALNQFQAPNEMAFEIHSERGSVKIDFTKQVWSVLPRGDKDWTPKPLPKQERDDWFVAQANAFIDGLEGKFTLMSTLPEALQTLKFNLAALESARTGNAVNIAPVEGSWTAK